MALISGEAVQDTKTLKWGYIIYTREDRYTEGKDENIIITPKFKYTLKEEAEAELFMLLKEFAQHIQK